MKSIKEHFIGLAIVIGLLVSANLVHADPYVFWVNNNYDRTNYDADDGVIYEDDVGPISIAQSPRYQQVPDYNYVNASGQRVIPTKRDLQDFARLWAAGITPGLVAQLPANSTITLSWTGVTADPTIDLFAAADPGIGYQTNETVATRQIDPVQCPYYGRISPTNSLVFTKATWPTNQFIWCGVDYGQGGLNLTIADGNGNTLAQTTVYIALVDIKQMYERWTVGDNPNVAPMANAVVASDGIPGPNAPFRYANPQDTNTPYILFVHGWNMQPWEKDRFAESAFKRLYWQGYQGRFGLFRWPTANGFKGSFSQMLNNPAEKDNFDNSERNAWLSAPPLLNKLNDLNALYPGHVYMLAHSMGNVVAGEAIRLAGNNQVVKTYVASQGAIVAHTYDATIPNYSFSVGQVYIGPRTPNIYGNWFANDNGGGAGHVINFYNVNDFALANSRWQTDQITKPDRFVQQGSDLWNYLYNGSINDPAPWNHFFKTNYTSVTVNFDIVNVVTNRYEVMAFAAEAYTTALGATPDVLNLTGNVDLTRSQNPRIWQPDTNQIPYGEHFYHSAEFRGDYPLQMGYWVELLSSEAFNLK